jgi:hypothetical protein
MTLFFFFFFRFLIKRGRRAENILFLLRPRVVADICTDQQKMSGFHATHDPSLHAV